MKCDRVASLLFYSYTSPFFYPHFSPPLPRLLSGMSLNVYFGLPTLNLPRVCFYTNHTFSPPLPNFLFHLDQHQPKTVTIRTLNSFQIVSLDGSSVMTQRTDNINHSVSSYFPCQEIIHHQNEHAHQKIASCNLSDSD